MAMSVTRLECHDIRGTWCSVKKRYNQEHICQTATTVYPTFRAVAPTAAEG